jgi:uroporphyrinogen decarboxylase
MIHDELLAKMTGKVFAEDHQNALSKWMKELLPPANFERHKAVRELLNFDWVHLFPIEPMVETISDDGTTKVQRDIWGQTLKITSESYEIVERPVNSAEELKTYRFPEVSSFLYSDIEKWARESDFWVTAQIDHGFFKVSQLVGFEQYIGYMYDHPSELVGFMERFSDFQKKLIDELVAAGANSIWFSNDHAMNSGPFLAPEQLKELDFRFTRELVDYVHSKGLLANYHCCGNVEKTLPYIIETGVSSLHAIQPSAGNDIFKYKREYGKDICFIGNFDMDYLMPRGSVQEIDARVKEMVSVMWEKHRTGYILATCNMLNNDQPVENAVILHMAAEKYGR